MKKIRPSIVLLTIFIVLGLVLSFFSKAKNKIVDTGEKVQKQVETITETIIPKPTVILESGIPDKHLIETSFVPQAPEKNWDQPWQDACEEAALLTAYYYLENKTPSLSEVKNDLLSIINHQESVGLSKDVNLAQLSKTANDHLNYQSHILDNPTLDDIKKLIAQDIPVIVPASGKKLFKENRHFNSGGPYYHALTILGYDDNRQKFTVHDVGTQYGAYFNYSYTLLMDSIHDFPTSGHKEDIAQGQSRIMYLIK